jgi:hypothetical protein
MVPRYLLFGETTWTIDCQHNQLFDVVADDYFRQTSPLKTTVVMVYDPTEYTELITFISEAIEPSTLHFTKNAINYLFLKSVS